MAWSSTFLLVCCRSMNVGGSFRIRRRHLYCEASICFSSAVVSSMHSSPYISFDRTMAWKTRSFHSMVVLAVFQKMLSLFDVLVTSATRRFIYCLLLSVSLRIVPR